MANIEDKKVQIEVIVNLVNRRIRLESFASESSAWNPAPPNPAPHWKTIFESCFAQIAGLK